jgi:hypothetical protein
MKDFSAQSRLVLIRVKVERAKKHLIDFDVAAADFRDAYKRVIGTDTDPKTLQAQQYFARLPITRFEVLSIAGDIIQNLRSALDHLAFQLVEAGQGRRIGERRGKLIAFPIFDTAKKYDALKTGKITGARKAAIKAIDRIKPYKSGNPTLWSLNYANNIDKHRHLIGVASDYLFIGKGFDGHFWQKAARPLFRGIFGSEVKEDAKSVFRKSLGQSKITEGQPLAHFLHEQVDFVDNLVGTFEWHLRPRRRRSRFP